MGIGATGNGTGAKSAGEITRLLERRRAGDLKAEEALFKLVFPELRRIAARHLNSERQGHILQPTALVHEAYIKMAPDRSLKNRIYFFAGAARAMRRILLDHARANLAEKRGGQAPKVSLDGVTGPFGEPIYLAPVDPAYVIDLENALCRLEKVHPLWARIIECRFYGGLTIPEIAECLNLAPDKVKNAHDVGIRWLRGAMTA